MMRRRKFIKITALTSAGVSIPITHLQTMASPEAILKPAAMITNNDDFYVLQKGIQPKLKKDRWRLGIMGLVKEKKFFNYEELSSLDSVTTMRTLQCIGDPIGTEQMSNAMWTGVPLQTCLKEAGVKSSAKLVVFRCADGYHTAIPIADAMHEKTLLAYKMNGVVLPHEHGFPIRLLNPGHYGTKNPKWIVTIELSEKHEGYWEKRGWDPVASVKLAAMIGTPAKGSVVKPGTIYTISGAAFDSSNHGGIKNIEVSVDAGRTWKTAEIWGNDSPLAWTLWKYIWHVPDEVGTVEILARATANDGLIQKETGFDANPAGAVSYHSISVQIAE